MIRLSNLRLLLSTAVLAITAVAVDFVGGATPALRAVTALPLVTVGVGFAATRALWRQRPLDAPLAVALAIALSVVINIATVLAFYAARVPLQPRPIVLADATITILGCFVGLMGVRREPDRQVSVAAALCSQHTWALVATAVVFAAGIAILSRPANNSTVAGYTALSAIRERGEVVRIEVINGEHSALALRLRISGAVRRDLRLTVIPGAAHSIEIARVPSGRQLLVTLSKADARSRTIRRVLLRARSLPVTL
jgi:hypothetical protein